MGIKMKIATTGLTALGRYLARHSSQIGKDIDNVTDPNPFNAKNANPDDEDEYMRNYGKASKGIPVPPRKPEVLNQDPLERDVSSWAKEDLEAVMRRKEYQYNSRIQKIVQSYFDWKYPGPQRFDATGRPY